MLLIMLTILDDPNVPYLLVETVEERATADPFVDEHESLQVVRLTQPHQQQDVRMSQPSGNVKGKGSLYIAQYPVYRTAQSAEQFVTPLADLFIPTPTQLLREAF